VTTFFLGGGELGSGVFRPTLTTVYSAFIITTPELTVTHVTPRSSDQ